VFKGCPYIEFGSLIIDKEDISSLPRAVVWRRDMIACGLELTEEQVIEWAILVGNDYTNHYPRDLYLLNGQPLLGLPTGYSQQEMSRIRDVIKAAEPAILSSNDPQLQLAIEFSRDLYELRSLEKYPVDDSEERVFALTKEQRSACQQQILTMMTASATSNLTSTALILNLMKIYRQVWSSFFIISDEHLLAIEMMHEHLNGPSISSSKSTSTIIPNWMDAMVAHNYQLLCKELFYLLSPSYLEDEHQTPESEQPGLQDRLSALSRMKSDRYPAPWMFYDGKIFHQVIVLARCKRAEAQAAATVSATSTSLSFTPAVLSTQALMKKTGTRPRKSSSKQQLPSSPSLAEAVPSSQPSPKTEATPAVTPAAPLVLPIDHHRDRILAKIASDRIVIIHGETGCGKSSRLPVMLYENAQARHQPCKMMISQPRRIAAASLMKRVRQSLGTVVGLRMGHGIKEEDPHSKIFFVTTGYLVRYVAHHPEIMSSHSHLIIDEVHERSIDSDILCLLVKNLLTSCPNLRIILMSATIHTNLYQNYFSAYTDSDMIPLSVGVRRYPITTYHLEDIQVLVNKNKSYAFPPHTASICKSLASILKDATGSLEEAINTKVMENQHEIVVSLIRSGILPLGTGVFVFVSGMFDITELSVKLEKIPNILVFVIHSDIPFEEQERIFEATPPGKRTRIDMFDDSLMKHLCCRYVESDLDD
jgi:hypothetical protein